MSLTPNRRIAIVALTVLVLDQLTKHLVKHFLYMGEERTIIKGFFNIVHWGNTGAAWSMLSGKNGLLAIVGLAALVVLFRSRHHFDAHTKLGQLALGLIFGGIVGNLTDRLLVKHVTDFLDFYVERRGLADAIHFPAFNLADSAICVGVGLLFFASFRTDQHEAATV